MRAPTIRISVVGTSEFLRHRDTKTTLPSPTSPTTCGCCFKPAPASFSNSASLVLFAGVGRHLLSVDLVVGFLPILVSRRNKHHRNTGPWSTAMQLQPGDVDYAVSSSNRGRTSPHKERQQQRCNTKAHPEAVRGTCSMTSSICRSGERRSVHGTETCWEIFCL